jgi:hypothetical protein
VANRLPLTPDWARHHGSTEDASFPSEQAIAIGYVRSHDCLEALLVFANWHGMCGIQSSVARATSIWNSGAGRIVPEQKCNVLTLAHRAEMAPSSHHGGGSI